MSCLEMHEREVLPAPAYAGTLEDISEEVRRARVKFPTNKSKLAALMEEVGELAKALIENEPTEAVYAEAIQVASTAVRIAEEGVPGFCYSPALIAEAEVAF